MTDESDVAGRTEEIFRLRLNAVTRRTSHMFAVLMIAQWVMGIVFAIWISPRTWAGTISQTHIHVFAAIILGAVISGFPVLMGIYRPESAETRHSIAVGQMLTSALLIHLTGGRIETHFHVFGSLAFLAFYRDWKVLATATTIVALDHGLRGVFWPQSVYGVAMIQPWRFLEHAGWVIFEDIFLATSVMQSLREMRDMSSQQAELEVVNRIVEHQVIERTQELTQANLELDRRLHELQLANEKIKENERLATIQLLATGISHDLRNPLGTIKNAIYYLRVALKDNALLKEDPAIAEFLDLADKELKNSVKIANDLLDLTKPLQLHLIAADPLEILSGALKSVQFPPQIKVVRAFSKEIPLLNLDPDRMTEVFVNLINNAVQAMPEGGTLTVNLDSITASSQLPEVEIGFRDTGVGIPSENIARIFEPLFTTKAKGTGIGLSICAKFVKSHGGRILVESSPGKGSFFNIRIPANRNGNGRA